MNCPRCGSTNPDGAVFCKNCGFEFTAGVSATGGGSPDRSVAPSSVTYAGFWRRLAAYLIDYLVLSAANSILLSVSWWLFSPILILTGWLYYSLMESSGHQATLGKIALGIVVTDPEGRRISFGRATGRYFGKILSGFIMVIGYIMIAFTEKKQGLHDILANTLVIEK